MLKSIFSPRPSKFGPGVGLLWRGNRLDVVSQFFFRLFSFSLNHRNEEFLFESARAAIYNSLVSQGIGGGHEVVISSFTCEAVSCAVIRAGARPVFVDVNDDLTMSDEEVLAALTLSTRAIIIQNTFGRLGLKLKTINELRRKGLFIIEDCALSIGSIQNGAMLGTFGDVAVWSMEVSKTATIGWGGVAEANSTAARGALVGRYANLGVVNVIDDFRRICQLWFSLIMVRYPVPGASLIWYFLYGTRIFRRSNGRRPRHPTASERMGALSAKLYHFMTPRLAFIFERTNQNYRLLEKAASKLDLDCPIMQRHGDRVVSPRFSIMVNSDQLDDVVRYSQANGVEVGRWFSDCPPPYKLNRCRVHGCENAQRVSASIINFPCHWSLGEEEIEKITAVMAYIAAQSSDAQSAAADRAS